MKNKDRPEVQRACVEFFAHHSISIVELLIPLGLVDSHEYISIPDWLNSEYVPFTDFELEVMKRIEQKFHWIARDKSGRLACFSEKPSRDGRYWHADGECLWRDLPLDMFHNIQWSDSEPVCIDDYVNRKEE